MALPFAGEPWLPTAPAPVDRHDAACWRRGIPAQRPGNKKTLHSEASTARSKNASSNLEFRQLALADAPAPSQIDPAPLEPAAAAAVPGCQGKGEGPASSIRGKAGRGGRSTAGAPQAFAGLSLPVPDHQFPHHRLDQVRPPEMPLPYELACVVAGASLLGCHDPRVMIMVGRYWRFSCSLESLASYRLFGGGVGQAAADLRRGALFHGARGGAGRRSAGAGARHRLVFVDRLVATPIHLRHDLPHSLLALLSGVHRSTITTAVGP